MVKEEVKVKIKDKVKKTSGFPFAPAYRRQRPRSYLAPGETGRLPVQQEGLTRLLMENRCL